MAKTKVRGRASVKYAHKNDKSKVLSHKEWKKLPEENRNDFVRTEVERREKECVSYARVWGEDKYAVGRTYYQLHTDYYNVVGHKYGLERGDDISMLPSEERRERVHKSKAILEAERQAKESITTAKANSDATQANIRANKATEQLEEMFAVPQIKEIWDTIQQNKKAFARQLDQWIAGALNAIATYARSGLSLFTSEQDNAVRLGILAQSCRDDLDSMDNDQRMQATHNLLEQVDWSGMTDFKIKYGRLRTEQSCQEMTVTREVVKSLLLAVGGQGGIGLGGGGGSSNELTNWDGTKKKTGWGIS